MISYRFGYGRGWRFVVKNWLALIAVPLSLIALFTVAFFYFDADASENTFVLKLNEGFASLGVGYRFGRNSRLGAELVGVSIWLMYFSVGWHYSKQVFGCMMVYAHYKNYPLGKIQKLILKGSVFSVAVLQFTYLYAGSENPDHAGLILSQSGYGITPLGLPIILKKISAAAAIFFFLATLTGVLLANYRFRRQLPPVNFIVPWAAFYVWWTPIFFRPEFTYFTVPFFHSLQYLPFAWRLETPHIAKNRWYYSHVTARILFLLLAGFIAFEFLPNLLDVEFESANLRVPGFFLTAFAVFINIHHFFIDSVVWKFNQSEVRESLLSN